MKRNMQGRYKFSYGSLCKILQIRTTVESAVAAVALVQ